MPATLNATYLADLIDPQVIADYIEKKYTNGNDTKELEVIHDTIYKDTQIIEITNILED